MKEETNNFPTLLLIKKINSYIFLILDVGFPLFSRECFTNIGHDITKIIKKLRGLKHNIEELKGLEIKIDLNHLFGLTGKE